ncbi:MAG: DUF2935 domain-containing protein [Hominenteromicrobium sp.]
MDNTQAYIVSSLELHLFFARIMKEHALFLKSGFLPHNLNEIREADRLLRQFERVLSRATMLSSGVVSCTVLKSGEICTRFTECAEQQTQRLTGTQLDRALTARQARLNGRACEDPLRVPGDFPRQIRCLNQEALALVNRLIAFKERLLNDVGACRLFTANYPLLIAHILREARLYRAYLLRLERRGDCSCRELEDCERFWNRIMMEHALFIRGLLDPAEDELIRAADGFAGDFRKLLDDAAAANDKAACSASLELTRKLRDFKQAGIEGIEACRIRSLILPLLADHVLREANHYIRLLEA